MIKMIVGLCNPQLKYHKTRHNVGSWYMYALAKYFFTFFKEEKKFLGFFSSLFIFSHEIRLFIPNIFMNLNGKAIFKIASFYKISLNEILIVHDDLELQPGVFKIKYSYGHNGHNGLRSIVNIFNQNVDFYRIRIGIGRPMKKDEICSFVLSQPTSSEKICINQSINRAIEKTIQLIA